MTTFREMLERRTTLRNHLTVYENIIHHLEGFVPSEVDDASAMEMEDGPPVSADVVEAVIEELRSRYLGPIKDQIHDLETLEIPDGGQNTETEEDSSSSSGPQGQAEAGGKGGSGGRKTGARRGANGSGKRRAGKIQIRGSQ